MVACTVTEECPLAVSAELLWKVFLVSKDTSVLTKACVGMIDTVEFEGDGGPGTVTTMKLNPAVGDAKVFKTRQLARDDAALALKWEMVKEGSDEAAAKFKSQVSEMKLVPGGEGGCVAKLTVEYELLDGTPLPQEEEAKIVQGYLGLTKKVEEYIVAHPSEFA